MFLAVPAAVVTELGSVRLVLARRCPSRVEMVCVVPACFEGRCGVMAVTGSALPTGSRHLRHAALRAISAGALWGCGRSELDLCGSL